MRSSLPVGDSEGADVGAVVGFEVGETGETVGRIVEGNAATGETEEGPALDGEKVEGSSERRNK